MEASVVQKHREHMWVNVGDHWAFSEPYAPSWIVDPLGFSVSVPLLLVGYGVDTFSPDPAWLVFSEPNIRNV